MKKMFQLAVPFVITAIHVVYCREIPDNFAYEECNPEDDVCEYWLNVEEKLSMRYNGIPLYARNGKLYKCNENPQNATTKIPLDDVITVDGIPRMVMTVNGTIPGPPIVVYENQTLVIHVTNSLCSQSLSIHWHGLNQRGTPFMDGAGYITQYPIGFGQSFTYTFKAIQSGTFWYHSHVGSQRIDGVFGAFIIKKRRDKNMEKIPIDVIMTVGDWQHEDANEVYLKMTQGNYIHNRKYKATSALDGSMFSTIPWVSGLIEGKGRYYKENQDQSERAPISWFNVKPKTTYRFRVIQTGNMYPLQVSIDNHLLKIISTDGYDVKPVIAESFIIQPGERFDFLLETEKRIRNYWIRAESIEVGVRNHSIHAVLHYDGAPSDTEPNTERKLCFRKSPCIIANCPFKQYPLSTYKKCVSIDELENADNADELPFFNSSDSEEYFLNFAFPGTNTSVDGAVNGRKFKFPTMNALTQYKSLNNEICDNKKFNCGPESICHCYNQLEIPFNKTIQMVLVNKGIGAGWSHPIHIHGHSFYVLKVEFAPQNVSTGKFFKHNGVFVEQNDVICNNDSKRLCNEPEWRNVSWRNGNIPRLNTKNPPRKDTLLIPSGGYAVIRIRSDNPGKWFMHCHVDVHSVDGMAMVLSEGIDKLPHPPEGFPECHNFPSVNLLTMDDEKENQKNVQSKDDTVRLQTFMLVTSVLVALIFLLFVLLLSLLKRKWSCVEPGYYSID